MKNIWLQRRQQRVVSELLENARNQEKGWGLYTFTYTPSDFGVTEREDIFTITCNGMPIQDGEVFTISCMIELK